MTPPETRSLRHRIPLLIAFALAVTAGSAVTAVAPGLLAEDPVVACAVPDAGVLYVVEDQCEETSHQRFDLATLGTVDGLSVRVEEVAAMVEALETTGGAGVSVVSAGSVTISDSQGGIGSLPRTTATCPDGRLAVAGGYEITAVSDDFDGHGQIGSRPTADGSGWQLVFFIDGGSSPSMTLDLYVTCVTPE